MHIDLVVFPGRGRMLAGAIAFAAALAAACGHAQDSGGQSLESAANDPTASLMSFQLQNFYTSSFHTLEGTGNTVQFRAAIPFTLGGVNNIARLTLPYVTDSPSGNSGLSDATLFNLAAFDQPWGRFGVGAVALLPVGSTGLSAEKWGLGPAFGFAAQMPWGLAGLFNQNIFTVAGEDAMPDVNISTLQPLLNYSLGDGWSVGLSEMTFVYDWDADGFTSLPLGGKVSRLTRLGGVPFQLQLSYEHNFYDDGPAPRDTLGLTAKILLPK